MLDLKKSGLAALAMTMLAGGHAVAADGPVKIGFAGVYPAITGGNRDDIWDRPRLSGISWEMLRDQEVG